MDEAAWGALTLALSLLGGIYTWWAYRHRGLVAALRGAGVSLIPLALLLTDTLKTVSRIVDAVGDWAVHLVFSPVVWAGVALGGLSVVLLVVAGFLDRRGVGAVARSTARADRTLPSGQKRGSAPVLTSDPELDEIEALLRKHGIS